MPYSVQHLLEKQGPVVLVHKDDPITAALDLMVAHDYGQLPVVDEEDNRLLGMVTYESVIRALRSFNTRLDKLCVRDALVGAPTHYREDDLFDLLDELKESNAVVIITPDGSVLGIVTSYDTSEFLRSRTEDLMHVEDIEFTIKEFIKKAHSNSKGEVDPKRLGSTVGKLQDARGEPSRSKRSRDFDELTLADYINLLTAKETWSFVAPLLAIEKEALAELLEKVRQTRNDLAHFRGEISTQERDQLKYCANWLRSRYRDYEKEREQDFLASVPKPTPGTDSTRAVQERASAYASAAEDGSGQGAGRSRYAALAGWLARQSDEQVALTFKQVESILRSPLPASALASRAWWANERAGHPHSAAWLGAGWKVSYVDLNEKLLVFARVKPE